MIGGMALAAVSGNAVARADRGSGMYGLIGKMKAQPGQRDALARILTEGTAEMPGCLSYVIAADPADSDLLWITEVWTERDAHAASLALPSVREAIAKGRPLIAVTPAHLRDC
jgi:quinol monooxygenase YgiN